MWRQAILGLAALGFCSYGQEPAIRTQIAQAEREAKAHANDPAVVGALAMTLHAYQRYDAAARAYSRANGLAPKHFDWLYLLGAVQIERGDFQGAATAFRSALQLRPSDVPAELRLADTLAMILEWGQAEAAYRHILAPHEDCAQAWYGLGRVQTAQGDHLAAAQSYEQAIRVFPAYAAAHFALAEVLRHVGNKNEAEQHQAAYAKSPTTEPSLDDPIFERIHDLNRSAQVHLQRGAVLDKSGKLDEAIQEHLEALAINPDNLQAHINLISLFARRGDDLKAKQHFEAAIKLSPGRSDAWGGYGMVLLREKNYGEAEIAFTRALDSNPDDAEAHEHLGAIYELQGQLDRAAEEFRRAIASRPNYPLARFHLGRILVNQEKYAEAISQLVRALAPEDEQTPTYQYALAATYARAGDLTHALEYFRAARQAAEARGQSHLLRSIDRDLEALANTR
jgi:tetratricopeptide (TPR) repeat protein